MHKKGSITLLYHFFYPDDVVSARHFSDMAEELVNRGWIVTVLTSNRYCRYPGKSIKRRREFWKNIEIIRVYRPGWDQSGKISRLGNAVWLSFAWLLEIVKKPKTDYYIIGSDPQFSQIIFPLLKLVTGGRKIVYWCYDLYPEAIVANNENFMLSKIANMLKMVTGICYRFADIIADLGPCMRKRLDSYNHNALKATLPPWALKEPGYIPDQESGVRKELFGNNVKLGLLYSGNLGKAHDFELFLKLARYVRKNESSIVFAFACRGNRFEEFKSSLCEDDYNIRIAGFASEEELEKRLAAADIHLISLRKGWDGVVVPSKFFGSLAVGRPVLYSGDVESDIAQWVHQYDCGLILNDDNLYEVADQLVDFAKNKGQLDDWKYNAFYAYRNHFSRKQIMDAWDELLWKNLSEDVNDE